MNFLESEQTAKTSTQSSMGCLHRESFCQSFPNGRIITYQSPNPSDNCQRLTQFQKQAKNPSSISSHSSSLERNEPEVQFLPTSYFHDAKNACKQDGNAASNVHRANASSMMPSNSAAPNPNSNAPVVMPNLIMPPTPNPTDSNHGFCNCPSGC